MKPFKYNVGDHVVIEKSNIEWAEPYAGKTGVVTAIDTYDNTFTYRVRLDVWDEDNLGVWCKVKCLVKEPSNDKVVITTDGVTTKATLYSKNTKVRTASAKCSPDDKFDFGVGAKIAMERLYPDKSEPTPKYLNCKFVLTSNSGEKIPRFTEGKVYELKNGVVTSDDGLRLPAGKPIMDEPDLRAYFAIGNRTRVPYSGISAKVIIIKE